MTIKEKSCCGWRLSSQNNSEWLKYDQSIRKRFQINTECTAEYF